MTAEINPVKPNPALTKIPGVKELLMGPAGTGKTTCIHTIVDTGMPVFYLTLEPGFESLIGYYVDQGKPVPPNLHWHYVAPPQADIHDMMKTAGNINRLSYDALTKLVDPNKAKYNQFYGVLSSLAEFIDDRTGENFKDLTELGNDTVVVIDSLTGLNTASMAAVVGGKPIRSQPDWQVAQDQLYKLLTLLCNSCKFHFVLLAHVERETDAVLGGIKLMVSTLGRKLAPTIPPLFSDVILTGKQGNKWMWDTVSVLADVKTRYLPLSADLPQDFRPIFDKWRTRATAMASLQGAIK